MGKAKQLPSGSWRVQIYAGRSAKGKKHYISITRATEDEANYAALAYKIEHPKYSYRPENYTLSKAIDYYIEARDAVFSPSTIREYRQLQKNGLQGIMGVRISRLTQEMIQREINEEAKTHAPKTVRNMHGLLSAILREYRPDFVLRTRLPQKEKQRIYIPDIQTVRQILAAVKDTEIEVPILLAVCLGLRKSEILGLKWTDVDFERNNVTICRAIVLDEHNKPTVKLPKTYAGTRTIPMPKILAEAMLKYPGREKSEYVVNISGSTLYKRFQTTLERNNLPHMRLHDLRHVNASVMLKLNVPNKYAAERMGHATEEMLRNVYQHTLIEETNDLNEIINDFFDKTLK